MSERHSRITTETLEHLAYLDTIKGSLTPFERDIVADRIAAVREFGDSAVLTEKQSALLRKLFLVKRLQSSSVSEGPS